MIQVKIVGCATIFTNWFVNVDVLRRELSNSYVREHSRSTHHQSAYYMGNLVFLYQEVEIIMKALKAISTVIELKPEKKYLLVFSGDGEEPISFVEYDRLIRNLRLEGIRGVGVALRKGQQIEVVEVE